jgi:RNA polymerase sigma-70 factor (ECF subfamily)
VLSKTEAVNLALGEVRAYLETLTFIQINPRLLSEFSMSDIVQNTLLEAWRDWERIEALGADQRKRWLRKMLIHNLIEQIEHCKAGKRDFRLKQSLEAVAAESSCRLHGWLAAEDTSTSGEAARREEALRVLEALSQLPPREREALILQQYHGWKLAQIGEHMGCTSSAVAGLHARGLARLRTLLDEKE